MRQCGEESDNLAKIIGQEGAETGLKARPEALKPMLFPSTPLFLVLITLWLGSWTFPHARPRLSQGRSTWSGKG